MEKVIYYRKSLMDKDELECAKKYFKCVYLLSDIPIDSFVIPRYSLYPFFRDQISEIKNTNCKPINDFYQIEYIADLQNYVLDLEEYTPKTYDSRFGLQNLPEDTAFILKGETNSKKSNWNKFMFAANKREAIIKHSLLLEDNLISQQNIYIREYVPLKTFMIGLNGIPITNEFRFFVAYGQIISGAYYWQNYVDDLPSVPDVNTVPKEFLDKVINKIKDKVNFVVIDVAQKDNGDWIVIELNLGEQSGLSCNDSEILYKNLHQSISNI